MRILVVKLSSLGDILHVLPCVHAIKKQMKANIDWVVHPEFAPIVRTFKDIDNVLTFPRRDVLKNFLSSVRALRKTRYDMVIDLHGLMKSAIVTKFAKAERKIGPSYSRELSFLFYPERAGKMHRDCHAAVQAFDTLDYLKLKRPVSPMSVDDFNLPDFNAPAGSPLIAIAPVSRWITKNWPKESFASFATLAGERLPNASFVIVGGKADYEAGEIIASALPAGRITNLCGKCSIAESMALLAKCDLLVSNDSGPVHMAAALGTPALVLFGPTRPDWTGPYGEGHKIIMRSLPCQPCLKGKCKFGVARCMTEITPEEVLAVVIKMTGNKE